MQYTTAKESLDKCEDRILELSTEMVSLVNAKDILERDNNELNKKVNKMEKLLSNEDSDTVVLRGHNQEMETKVINTNIL